MILGAIIIFFLIFNSDNLTPREKKEKPKPLVSIGCNRVLWDDSQEVLEATVNNISNPSFEWKMNDNLIGTSQKLIQKFGVGDYSILLNVTFYGQALSAKKSIQVIDSVDGITMNEYAVSKNQWGFQTMFKGKNTGVKDVMVYVDSLPPLQVNDCGAASTKALFSGKHTWKARYHEANIASGTFDIKETSELKINRIEIAPGYTAGSVVKAKLVLMNTGSVAITEFATNTLVVNNDYAWMGDRAKRQYSDQYKADIDPGETYEIPIQMTIPEKVSGVRPSGKYTITIDALLNGVKVDTKIVNTVVK
ncbi:MAG: hypothetical protein C3F06_03905 [Candidatus Methanoperedenaceae archaeon]|nr:MAG: hypothetical protein C3F06_03905 [Candidatus Methanoperedenaceae archaeon]